jgi:Tfp pilus assembly protein PilZ
MGTWTTARSPRPRPNRGTTSSWGSSSAKRAHDRIPFEARATIIAGDRRIRSSTGDLSEAGAFMRTSMPPELGETVLFTVQVDQGLTLATEATVVWIDRNEEGAPTGCGLSFVQLSPDTRMALRARLQPELCAPEQEEAATETDETVANLLTRFIRRIAG